jgi:hypothetical protein
MAIKTFNVDAMLYKEYSEHCKAQGISMSKKVENFIREELDKIKASIPGKFFGIKDSKIEPQKDLGHNRSYVG